MSSSTTKGTTALLTSLIVTMLAPMFLWSCDGDVTLARAAAAETLNAYCAKDHLTLVRAAKVIAFDLATLASLGMSMSDDVSVSMALRLRGNANSLDRAAERNRAALEQDQRNAAMIAQADGPTDDEVAASVAAARQQVEQAKARIQPQQQPAAPRPPASPTPSPTTQARAPMSEQQRKTAWAGAMADVAAEMSAGLAGLPPAERAAELERIEALTQTIDALSSGGASPIAMRPAAAR